MSPTKPDPNNNIVLGSGMGLGMGLESHSASPGTLPNLTVKSGASHVDLEYTNGF